MSTWTIFPMERPLEGEVVLPGDKSISHRALIFSAIARGPTELRGLSTGDDVNRTMRAMMAMGVPIERGEADSLVVRGGGLDSLQKPPGPIDCGNSGTSMRLLAGLLSAQPFASTLVGDESLSKRPMQRLIAPLAAMGGQIKAHREGSNAVAPLHIQGSKRPLKAVSWRTEVASAQVKSAALIAGLYCNGVTILNEPGRSRNHSELMLQDMGAPISCEGAQVKLNTLGWDRALEQTQITVPGDPSAAAFVVVAALMQSLGSEVCIRNVGLNPRRSGFLDAVALFGGKVCKENRRGADGEPIADLRVLGPQAGELCGALVSGELALRSLDEIPILAVLAASAKGVTVFSDVAELRHKECDRISATVDMLAKLGVQAEAHESGFTVQGRGTTPFKANRISSRGDHRIAMSAAVAGLRAEGPIVVDGVESVQTSFPDFSETFEKLGVTPWRLAHPARV